MWAGGDVKNLFWRIPFLDITAKIRLVMGSYFQKLKKKFKTQYLWKKSWVIEAKVNDLPFKISSTSKNEFKFLITALHFDF
jgi:hypothetical protein